MGNDRAATSKSDKNNTKEFLSKALGQDPYKPGITYPDENGANAVSFDQKKGKNNPAHKKPYKANQGSSNNPKGTTDSTSQPNPGNA